MAYNPNIHHRHSIRLPNYDYSQEGLYFVTICVQNREYLFGDIQAGEMMLNDAGRMIEKWYQEIPNKFTDIELGEYIVMPNHFHAIIVNTGVGAHLCVRPDELWQRNYYEHIIRNAQSLQHISDYIVCNPNNWEDDELYNRTN